MESTHSSRRAGGGGWCTVCRDKSMTWSKLAPKECRGSAVATWSAKAYELTLASGIPGRRHCIGVSGSLFWCVTCGAFVESAPKLLTKGCRGSTKEDGSLEACGDNSKC